ncbi:LysM domain protein [Cordyceps fumosorosea ARSEF 2679]|uniref:LysM domain protein n=1 Tax=Cordyceps fumosorosea (strain ARSEF 2679) TaxID=1081104 RepID=A0A168CM28_CORFA|nr:LysM domain protein [Cordyceps fumosorosea ARSEF 2679]OAA71545.1 LysM domain protein [Cordyceps fumosorosea ARSEF 2679]
MEGQIGVLDWLFIHVHSFTWQKKYRHLHSRRDEQRTAALGTLPAVLAAASQGGRQGAEPSTDQPVHSVTAYSTSTACITLGHLYPRGTDVSVTVNVELLLETLAGEATRTGEWVNVIGYVKGGSGSAATATATVQAVMVWPAGPMDIQQYEAALEEDYA